MSPLPALLSAAAWHWQRGAAHAIAGLMHRTTQGGSVYSAEFLRRFSSLPPHTVLNMPALSPTMSAGNLAKWHVQPGDVVRPGTVLAEVETDKATLGFENQDDGFVAKLLVPDGARNVEVGTPVLVLVEDEAAIPAFANYAGPQPGGKAPSSGAGANSSPAASSGAAAAAAPAAKPSAQANYRLGPAVRMLLSESGLSAADVAASGPNGILTKGDVLAAIAAGVKPKAASAASSKPAAAAAPAAAPAPAAAAPAPAAAAKPAAPAASSSQAASFTDTPNSQIRRVIAARLLESKLTAPALYIAADVSLDALGALRRALAEERGVKLSVNDFVLRAAALALKEVPRANAYWDAKAGEAVVQPVVDISVAVATDKGLITPIVRGADTKAVGAISKEVRELAGRARDGKLKPEEFMGGTFTVSNLGMFGVNHFSAIINPPQAAIMAVGGAQERVVLKDGKPTTSTFMTVTLSADHRVFDGELASDLLAAFKKGLESPLALLA